MSKFNVVNLADVTGHNAFTANSVLRAAQLNNAFGDIQDSLIDLNDAAQAIATCQASIVAPANKKGELWYDTSNTAWLGDPDESGHDDDFLTRLKAYTRNPKLASTETARVGGVIHVDMGTYTRTTDGVLAS